MKTSQYPIEKALKKYYGYDSFRPGQEDIIQSLLQKKDVLAIMPTGSGKSVCYQIPAIFMPGITLVISPLISLMRDQVAALKQAGIPAAYFNSTLTSRQYSLALERASQGAYKIIYVAPERLATERFLAFASSVNISMIAVDEAHCISQWGQNFRPSYLEIAQIYPHLASRPVLAAFTATATGPVKSDIISLLQLDRPHTMVTGFDRPNLYFEVRKPRDRFEELLSIVQEHPEESGIIYCITRKQTEELCQQLKEAGYSCAPYHAGMSDEERSRVQDDFVYDRQPLIAATSAFGMGIDKSNVRYVVHWGIPSSLEEYYQEAGRAGRDGEPASCILLYSGEDYRLQKFLIEKNAADMAEKGVTIDPSKDLRRLSAMYTYTQTPLCLRSFILSYFGEASSSHCSNCSNCRSEWFTEDVTQRASRIFQAMQGLPYSYGMALTEEFLRGAKTARIKDKKLNKVGGYGMLADMSAADLHELMESLLFQGYLQRSDDKYQVISCSDEFEQAISSQTPIVLQRKATVSERKEIRRKQTETLHASASLMERLRSLRLTLARQKKLPPYLVFNDNTLHQMASLQPSTREEMLKISGVSEEKMKQYGSEFLAAISHWKAKSQDD